jgi:hypothetical protein
MSYRKKSDNNNPGHKSRNYIRVQHHIRSYNNQLRKKNKKIRADKMPQVGKFVKHCNNQHFPKTPRNYDKHPNKRKKGVYDDNGKCFKYHKASRGPYVWTYLFQIEKLRPTLLFCCPIYVVPPMKIMCYTIDDIKYEKYFTLDMNPIEYKYMRINGNKVFRLGNQIVTKELTNVLLSGSRVLLTMFVLIMIRITTMKKAIV